MRCHYQSIIIFILLFGIGYPAMSQGGYTLRLGFTDKVGTLYTIDDPTRFLSDEAIKRRNMQGIPVTEEDLPLSPVYLDSLVSLGYSYRNPSKWFNSVLIEVGDSAEIDELLSLSFIQYADVVAVKNVGPTFRNKFEVDAMQIKSGSIPNTPPYGEAYPQINLHNGQVLHEKGFRGANMSIAVIDAGFYHVNNLPAFNHLWANNQIIGWKDFVGDAPDFFSTHNHGMKVLSIIGGQVEDIFLGTAPDAKFWLLRSEDVYSEMLVEEDNWVRAAEFADSAGVDIINSSLGYSIFDYPWMNHTYADMNGKTTRITQAATKASNKGMIVVISAGNEGNSPWYYITAPGDADSILTIGAVNNQGITATFSSHGPTFDNRIKPDVVATGWGTFIQSGNGSIASGNGTSFSAPVMTGLVACLWQAHPYASNHSIIKAVKASADKINSPDENYGFGIPDMALAHKKLEEEYKNNDEQTITLLTSEFDSPSLVIASKEIIGDYNLVIYSIDGRLIDTINGRAEGYHQKIKLNRFSTLKTGIYLIYIKTSLLENTFKYLN